MAYLKVDYYKDMGTGEKLIRAKIDKIEVLRAAKPKMFKVRLVGAAEWCNELVHIDNLLTNNGV